LLLCAAIEISRGLKANHGHGLHVDAVSMSVTRLAV